MLINNWYVAATSEQVLPEAPYGVRMLGLDFVLFRNSDGDVSCLSDVCCHRGGALADGILHGDCIACPYHGWQYDVSGKCVLIPSMGPDAKIPSRARVDSYPTEERYGWVWVFLGDLAADERPPLPELYPEYDQSDTWRAIPYQFDAPANWVRLEENSLDTIHTSFVHSRFGGRVDPASAAMPITETKWGARVARTKNAPGHDRKSGALADLLPKDRKKTSVELEFSIIGVCHRIQPTFREGMSQINFSARTPIDPTHTRVFGWQARNYLVEPEHDAERAAAIMEAVGEDLAVVTKVRPPLTPPALPREFLVEADSMELAFRRRVSEFEARGWEIDYDAYLARSQREVLVIPSPARRVTGGSWVQKTIPMKPGNPARAREAGENNG
jgi:phenylpropionate dioxygenase-like ring-hydroxylating dioxygenase large terminal subunit